MEGFSERESFYPRSSGYSRYCGHHRPEGNIPRTSAQGARVPLGGTGEKAEKGHHVGPLLDIYPPRLLTTAHVHLLMVGFMLMMVMGVATWMFPRPARDDTHYRPEVAAAVYWVMTAATALRALAEATAGLAGALASSVYSGRATTASS